MTSINNMYNLIRDPFHPGSSEPKIPDGSLTSSYGGKYAAIGNMTVGKDGIIELLMLPCSGGLFINTGDAAAHANGAVADPVPPVTQSTPSIKLGDSATPVPWTQVRPVGLNKDLTDGVASYRLVSQGLKLSMTSVNLLQDGNFSSIRVPLGHVPYNNYCIDGSTLAPSADKPNATEDVEKTFWYPTSLDVSTSTYMNDATFSEYPLRDLNRVQFFNRRASGSYDLHPYSEGLPVADKNFDGVYIRISATPGTKVKYHFISNWEVSRYGEMARYQTPCYGSEARANRLINGLNKIVYPIMPATMQVKNIPSYQNAGSGNRSRNRRKNWR